MMRKIKILRQFFLKLIYLQPKYYAYIYLSIIPIYAFIYYYFYPAMFKEHTFAEAIYFSAITITTLGYGDILPIDDVSRILAAMETILGITFIGLFINAISNQRTDIIREEDKLQNQYTYRKIQIMKFLNHYKLAEPFIISYKDIVFKMSNNQEFSLNSLAVIYNKCSSFKEDISSSSIEVFYKNLHFLNIELSDIIKNIDLNIISKTLEKDLIDFLHASYLFNSSGYILHLKNSDKYLYTIESLKNYNNEIIDNDHILIAFDLLLKQIKQQLNLINSIEKEVEKYKYV